MEQKLNIDDVLEDALDQDCFKDDVLRRTEERLKANLAKTMDEFKKNLELFFSIKNAMAELPNIKVGPVGEEKPASLSMQLPGICCDYTAEQDGITCQGVLRIGYPEGRNREFYINGAILLDNSHRYGTCMPTVYIYRERTIADVPQIINDFRTVLRRTFFDHDLRNRKDR